eukprot:Opistho-1_new@42772
MDVKVYGVRAMNSPEAQPFYEALGERPCSPLCRASKRVANALTPRETATRTNAINIDFQDFRVMTDMFLAGELRVRSGNAAVGAHLPLCSVLQGGGGRAL